MGGGAQDTFSYQLFIILKLLGGARAHPDSPPCSAVPVLTCFISFYFEIILYNPSLHVVKRLSNWHLKLVTVKLGDKSETSNF